MQGILWATSGANGSREQREANFPVAHLPPTSTGDHATLRSRNTNNTPREKLANGYTTRSCGGGSEIAAPAHIHR